MADREAAHTASRDAPYMAHCHILEHEAISIRAIEPPALSEERKHELIEQLKKYFAEIDARRMPGSPEEAEDIINEAMKSVRPGYRPHQ